MTAVSEPNAPSEWVGVGQRLREARESSRISVRELARRVDVSPGHISNVERGLASLSVRSLYSIVNELGISMDSLFEPVIESPDDASAASPSGEAPASTLATDGVAMPAAGDDLEAKGIVLRGNRRPTIPLPTGTRWERLSPQPELGAEFIEVVYPPATQGTVPDEFTMHSSREYGVITHGALTVQVGFDVSVLQAGDSIVFNSTTPHRFWNATDEEVRAIWFIWDGHMTADQPGDFGSGADGDLHRPRS